MKLTNLDATFIGEHDPETGSHTHDVSFEEAQALEFRCPKCGKHHIFLWFKDRVDDPTIPEKQKWTIVSGNGLDNLTLQPSILTHHPCSWHGYVRDGEAK